MDTTLLSPRYLGLSVALGRQRALTALETLHRWGGAAALLWHNDNLPPNVAGGYTNNRVIGGIVSGRSFEQGDADAAFPQVRGIAVEGPLGPDAIARLFERIIDEARTLERRVVHGEHVK